MQMQVCSNQAGGKEHATDHLPIARSAHESCTLRKKMTFDSANGGYEIGLQSYVSSI